MQRVYTWDLDWTAKILLFRTYFYYPKDFIRIEFFNIFHDTSNFSHYRKIAIRIAVNKSDSFLPWIRKWFVGQSFRISGLLALKSILNHIREYEKWSLSFFCLRGVFIKVNYVAKVCKQINHCIDTDVL